MPDEGFYLNEYGGVPYDNIGTLLKRAANIIDCAVIVPAADWQQRYLDLAVCAEAEYIGSCGGVEGFADILNGNVSSLTVGSFSVSKGGSDSGGQSGKSAVPCSAALAFLDRGGLLGRRLT